jgi:signal transduction histidine kinase
MIMRADEQSAGTAGGSSNGHWRVTTATRVFALATALGLAAATGRLPELTAPFLTLCALAVVMSAPVVPPPFASLVPIADGGLAAVLLVTVESPGPLLICLVVPPFASGVKGGLVGAATATAAESVAMLALILAGETTPISRHVDQVAPWILVGLGMGLLGARMRLVGGRNSADQAGYESAHRLLGQLRAVSRRLSSGLDTSTLANRIVAHTAEMLQCDRALLLVGSDASTLAALASYGMTQTRSLQDDSAIRHCWAKKRAARGTTVEGDVRHRTVLPLRVAGRTIGVVLTDTVTPPSGATLKAVQRYLDEQALRLETTLLFDEVRTTATTEERNRLAREIHDGVAQEIASLGYLVDELTATAAESAGEEVARELRRELTRIVTDLRLSIFDLRTGVGPHGGLGAALSDYAREVGTRTGMTVHLALSEQPQRLQVGVEAELMRIAQEAMTNARKHSRANNLWVTLNTESPIASLRIEDDGVGSARTRDDHYGLHIMRERAQRIGAEVTICDRPRGGTSVMVTVWPNNNTSTGGRHEHLSLAG